VDLIGLIPSLGNLVFTLAAFVVALSVIVAIHEFGHYIVARWCGIHAEVFSLGFGPRLLSWRDRRGTLWQLAALPLGGYVKFLGDADPASAGADDAAIAALPPEERARAMQGAPLWARAATVAAGPAFNFILSILVITVMVLWVGQARVPLTVETLTPLPSELQQLQSGDVILAVAGKPVDDLAGFDGLSTSLADTAQVSYDVERDGKTVTVEGPNPFPPLVGSVTPRSAAIEAGLQAGDYIEKVDGTAIASFDDLRKAVAASDGKPMQLTVWRAGQSFEVTLTPKPTDVPKGDGSFEHRYLIGVTGGLFFEPRTEVPSPLEALHVGVSQTWFIVSESVSGLWHMLTGAISTCNLSGPIGIAETSSAAAKQGPGSFIRFIAVLSAAVGLFNLFPVPVLDGGHLVFYAYEALSGRPPSERALRVLMAGGLALILALMVFAVSNDLFCP